MPPPPPPAAPAAPGASLTLAALLNARFRAAFAAVGAAELPPLVHVASKPEFGDYQVNGVMAAAKALKQNPRTLGQAVVEAVDLAGIAAEMNLAGPGFINISLADDWLAARLRHALDDAALGVPARPPARVMVEYSSVNLAKEMHVGHLRSTLIGDCLARVQALVGAEVIRQNHVGDWGTQFGMLLAHLVATWEKKIKPGSQTEDGGGDPEIAAAQAMAMPELADLEALYRTAKQRFDADPVFAATARHYVVRLQEAPSDKNRKYLGWWQAFVDVSLSHCQAVYARLGVQLTRADVRGESAYNDDLPVLVADLRTRGLLVEDAGAQVVFLPEQPNAEGKPSAVIVQKKDGGYLYTTTDLAAIRYRVNLLHLDRCLYVVDSRQALHFRHLFAVAQKAGFYDPQHIRLEHVPFGTMTGADGKPFKTRSGDTVKLIDLLTEADERAFALVSEKNPDLPTTARQRIAHAVGVGAVKYADLSRHRESDYRFDWDTMLAFEGNTAPYLQYAYARIKSVFRRVGEGAGWDPAAPITLHETTEHALALQLARFGDIVHQIAEDSLPHLLCAYLYELASTFSRFYEYCPILGEGVSAATRASRLNLCQLTARTLGLGLGLLGIEVLEEM